MRWREIMESEELTLSSQFGFSLYFVVSVERQTSSACAVYFVLFAKHFCTPT